MPKKIEYYLGLHVRENLSYLLTTDVSTKINICIYSEIDCYTSPLRQRMTKVPEQMLVYTFAVPVHLTKRDNSYCKILCVFAGCVNFFFGMLHFILSEPVHEISNNVVCATSKA